MDGSAYPYAMFEGLVVDEAGQPARVANVGGNAFYVVDSEGFERHVEAAAIDREVLQFIKQQVLSNREEVTRGMLGMLGKDDLFTKAMVDSSINRMDEVPRQTLPQEARTWLGMLGFRIVIDLHGEIVKLELPSAPDPDAE
jgi:hypothetical protein